MRGPQHIWRLIRNRCNFGAARRDEMSLDAFERELLLCGSSLKALSSRSMFLGLCLGDPAMPHPPTRAAHRAWPSAYIKFGQVRVSRAPMSWRRNWPVQKRAYCQDKLPPVFDRNRPRPKSRKSWPAGHAIFLEFQRTCPPAALYLPQVAPRYHPPRTQDDVAVKCFAPGIEKAFPQGCRLPSIWRRVW